MITIFMLIPVLGIAMLARHEDRRNKELELLRKKIYVGGENRGQKEDQ